MLLLYSAVINLHTAANWWLALAKQFHFTSLIPCVYNCTIHPHSFMLSIHCPLTWIWFSETLIRSSSSTKSLPKMKNQDQIHPSVVPVWVSHQQLRRGKTHTQHIRRQTHWENDRLLFSLLEDSMIFRRFQIIWVVHYVQREGEEEEDVVWLTIRRWCREGGRNSRAVRLSCG